MIPTGTRLDGKYRVARWLGGGGFGDVYLAADEAIPGRQVAVKALNRPADGEDSNLVWEMRALAALQHPNVVAFYHHFTDGDRLFFVMEYCPGGSLAHRLKAAGRLPVEQVFAWGLSLCDALAYVHGRDVVHHDVKPLNVLFAADGAVKLGDFGVANRNMGTRVYLPPEMLLGESPTRLDPRVDVYALGLTLLECLTGRHPFLGLKPDEQLVASVEHDFVPGDLPGWVQEVLRKATHPTPELRFQTAADFGEAIRAKHVAYPFDGKRIRADAQAKKAEAALARRKWRQGERLATAAAEDCPESVPALLAAGRSQLALRRYDRAAEFFTRALGVSPRTPVQKELGWIHLEQGRVPAAISLLTDHLHRNASDYEAYNLLLKCFYLTDRFEAGESLARTLMAEKAPSDCFYNNGALCLILRGAVGDADLARHAATGHPSPFVTYNLAVAAERPPAWTDEPGSLKSKLLFAEYQFCTGTWKKNTLAVDTPDGKRRLLKHPIVTVGSSPANDVVIRDPSVSRRHCAVVNHRDDVWLYDLGSTVGTTIDGESLEGRAYLEGVHDVTVGRVRIRVASSSDRLL